MHESNHVYMSVTQAYLLMPHTLIVNPRECESRFDVAITSYIPSNIYLICSSLLEGNLVTGGYWDDTNWVVQPSLCGKFSPPSTYLKYVTQKHVILRMGSSSVRRGEGCLEPGLSGLG